MLEDEDDEAVEDAFRYGKLVLATTTYNGDVFPFMKEFIHHLTERGYQKRTVGLIENGTWGPTAGRTMKGILEGMKNLTVCDPMVTIKSTMNAANVEAMEQLADAILAD